MQQKVAQVNRLPKSAGRLSARVPVMTWMARKWRRMEAEECGQENSKRESPNPPVFLSFARILLPLSSWYTAESRRAAPRLRVDHTVLAGCFCLSQSRRDRKGFHQSCAEDEKIDNSKQIGQD